MDRHQRPSTSRQEPEGNCLRGRLAGDWLPIGMVANLFLLCLLLVENCYQVVLKARSSCFLSTEQHRSNLNVSPFKTPIFSRDFPWTSAHLPRATVHWRSRAEPPELETRWVARLGRLVSHNKITRFPAFWSWYEMIVVEFVGHFSTNDTCRFFGVISPPHKKLGSFSIRLCLGNGLRGHGAFDFLKVLTSGPQRSRLVGGTVQL